MGGDEFTIVLPELRDRERRQRHRRQVPRSLHRPFDLDGHEVHISASIGIAHLSGRRRVTDELLRHADIAMYQVKAAGQERPRVLSRRDARRVAPEVRARERLRRALDSDELEMHYQPQIDVSSGRIVGAEALMRWNHPQRGLLDRRRVPAVRRRERPDAADLGLDDRRAVPRHAQWNAPAAGQLRLSLNLSPQYLDRGDFFEKMRGALVRYGISPRADRGRDHREHLHPQPAARDRAAATSCASSACRWRSTISAPAIRRCPTCTASRPHHQDRPVLRARSTPSTPLSGDPGDHLDRARPGPAPDRRRRRDRAAGDALRTHGCDEMQGFLFGQPLEASAAEQMLRQGAGALLLA